MGTAAPDLISELESSSVGVLQSTRIDFGWVKCVCRLHDLRVEPAQAATGACRGLGEPCSA